MQTVAAFTAPVRGIVYINGRFAGECGPDAPLITPVSPEAMLYGEFRPLDSRYIPCACAVGIKGGAVDGNGDFDGVYLMEWPGNVIEIEFAPRSAYPPESEYGMLDGFPTAVIRGEGTLIRISGQSVGLDEWAALPDRHISGNCEVFLGDTKAGQYMACFSTGDMTPLGIVTAGRIEPGEDETIVGFTDLGDIVGHMRVESWKMTETGPEIISTEHAWAKGAPDWPKNAESTAIAACQAAILGLWGEAEGYLAGHLKGKDILKRLCEGADGCAALPYATPDSRRAVGLIRNIGRRRARAEAVYYRAQPDGGTQGLWTVEFMDVEK